MQFPLLSSTVGQVCLPSLFPSPFPSESINLPSQGNFLEFLPILSLMKQRYTPATLPYHLIVPSMPGYAFSDTPPLTRDFANKDVAALMNQLLLDLGFGDGYIAQGGDIGASVAKLLGVTFESCKAVHVNFCPVLSPPPGLSVDSLTEWEKVGLARAQDFMTMGSAYSFEHATRPATIGIALDSSPLALLAWIGEKFLSWSDVSPSLETILESVSLYWFTESMGRGIFPYRGVSFLLLVSFPFPFPLPPSPRYLQPLVPIDLNPQHNPPFHPIPLSLSHPSIQT